MYTFTLVGPHAGKTIKLGDNQFIDGEMVLGPVNGVVPSEQDISRKSVYLRKAYQAFLKGSLELEAAQEAFDAGEPISKDTTTIDDKEIPVQKTGEELAAENAATIEAETTDAGNADGADGNLPDPADVDAVTGDDGAANEAPAETPAEQVAPAEKPAGKSPRAIDGSIRTALTKLDPKNDEQWTSGGLPSVEAVRSASGNEEVSRADIKRLAPNLTREEAAKVAADPLSD